MKHLKKEDVDAEEVRLLVLNIEDPLKYIDRKTPRIIWKIGRKKSRKSTTTTNFSRLRIFTTLSTIITFRAKKFSNIIMSLLMQNSSKNRSEHLVRVVSM